MSDTGFARRAVALVFLAAMAIAALAAPRPVAASCLEIALADIPQTPSLVVLAGNVVSIEPRSVRMGVARWYVGDDPQLIVDIFGGLGSNEPGAVTSVDWNPARGESYLVVAERTPDGQIFTKPCYQFLASTAKLDEATAAFGEAIDPSVEGTAAPSPSGGGSGVAPPADDRTGSVQAWLPILALVATAALASAAWAIRQRRSP